MGSLARALLPLLLLIFPFGYACAQAQPAQKTGTGVITGRVTLGDRGVPDITVMLAPGEPGPERKAVAKTTTDVDGNYRLINLPPGRYNIAPVAPTLTGSSDSMYGSTGRSLILGEGETVEKMDFALARGGVITGRVTDSDGKPVIEERIQIAPADNQRPTASGFYFNPFMFQTDDRGVYRIYGVPAGRYIISAGVSPQDGMVRVGLVSRSYYQRVFHPNETDRAKATVVEVAEGGEVKDVDIRLSRPVQAFRVSGRVVDADTGRPVPNLIIGYGSYRAEGKRITSFGYGQSRTDQRGQFQMEGVVPGSYAAFTWNEEDMRESYTEPAPFEVTDADISGLEVKTRRGASLSGVAQIEGTSDKAILARLSQLALGVNVQARGITAPSDRRATIGADGTFRITGLQPGKATLYLYSYPPLKDIRLARVERDGVAQPNGVDVAPGADVSNLRVVFEYGSGILRGQLRVDGGELPQGTRMTIMVSKEGAEPEARPISFATVDSRGKFLIEGLPTGHYLLNLRVHLPPGSRFKAPEIKQTVSIASGLETETTLILDLTQKEPEGTKP